MHRPLRDDEHIPVPTHRIVLEGQLNDASATGEDKKSKKHRKEKGKDKKEKRGKEKKDKKVRDTCIYLSMRLW